MSQHDFNISDQGFPAARSDLNDALAAGASNSTGATAPATTFPNQWWYDTTVGIMKKSNNADTAWEEFSPGGGGGWVPLSSQTVSNVDSIDFTTGIDSTYDAYSFFIRGLASVDDNAHLWIRSSSNGGVSFDLGATDYSWGGDSRDHDNSVGNGGSFNDIKYQVTVGSDGLASVPSISLYAYVDLWGPSSNGASAFRSNGVHTGLFSDRVHFDSFGIRRTGAINAVQFLMSTGQIKSGSISLYGLTKP